MIATKRSRSEVGARALGRVNAGRDWRDGMERGSASAKWRRVTGITLDHEGALDRAELRWAGRRLVRWVERFFARELERRKTEAPAAVGVALQWVCARGNGGALERVCGALGISAARFNRVTKSILNVTGREFVEGLHLRGVRVALRSRVISAAKELWGAAGSRTEQRVMDGALKVTRPAGTWMVWPGRELVRDAIYTQRAARVQELFERVEAAWRDGVSDRHAFALELGFADFSRLNRACLNVDGESVRQKIRRLCCDVVDYFIAAEAKVLRELAARELETPAVIRARWWYSGGVERCGELPDAWNALEFGRADLIEEMMGAVGPPCWG